ncbi:hypothetical protein CsSME_00019312 [Camellia sinensis var. sinensis]
MNLNKNMSVRCISNAHDKTIYNSFIKPCHAMLYVTVHAISIHFILIHDSLTILSHFKSYSPIHSDNQTEGTTQWVSSQHNHYTNTSICYFTNISSLSISTHVYM